jgi:hypothetical protein
MQLSRMLELLSSDVVVSYSSLRRFLARTGLVSHAKRTMVRMAPSAPGEIAEMDFGRLGTLVHAHQHVPRHGTKVVSGYTFAARSGPRMDIRDSEVQWGYGIWQARME